ncbi:MAG: hypothetical protein K9G33_10615, partial [Sneathiella sp.]|nr:hypothetical protein [Sneathiella sp.]
MTNRAAAGINALIQSDASYDTYLDHIVGGSRPDPGPMSEAFWGPVKRNWRTDVRAHLRAVDVPVLAPFGSHDAYVDPIASARAYRRELTR